MNEEIDSADIGGFVVNTTETKETRAGSLLRRIPTGQLARGAVTALVIQIFSSGLNYLTLVILARWLRPGPYGVYAYATSWYTVLSLIAGLGLPVAVVRFLPEYQTRGDWSRFRGVVRSSVVVTALSGAMVAVFGSLVMLAIPAFARASSLSPMLLGLFLTLPTSLSLLITQLVRTVGSVSAAFAPPGILRPLLLLLAVLALYHRTEWARPAPALLLTIGATIITLGVQWLLLRRALPSESRHATPQYETRFWMSTALPMLIATGSLQVLIQSDGLMLGLLKGASQVGLYVAASRTAAFVTFIQTASNAVLAPRVAALYARQDSEGLRRLIRVSVTWVFWPSFALSLAIALLGKPILSLFGPQFIVSLTPLWILALAQLFNASAGPVVNLMSMTGHQKQTARVTFSTLLIATGLNLVLIPPFGAIGAACATACSTIIWNAWLGILVWKLLGVSTFPFDIPRRRRAP